MVLPSGLFQIFFFALGFWDHLGDYIARCVEDPGIPRGRGSLETQSAVDLGNISSEELDHMAQSAADVWWKGLEQKVLRSQTRIVL